MDNKQITIRIKEAEDALETIGQYINYRRDDIHSREEIIKVCTPFIKRGFHAKINYYKDHRKPYQCYIIQKKPFDLSKQGQMVYSEILKQ